MKKIVHQAEDARDLILDTEEGYESVHKSFFANLAEDPMWAERLYRLKRGGLEVMSRIWE